MMNKKPPTSTASFSCAGSKTVFLSTNGACAALSGVLLPEADTPVSWDIAEALTVSDTAALTMLSNFNSLHQI